MKKRLIAVFLVLVMSFVPAAAFAGPAGPPPPPPAGGQSGPPGPPPGSHHSHGWYDDRNDFHWGDVATGLSIAVLLGTLINNARHQGPVPQDQQQPVPADQYTAEVKARAKDNADKELAHLLELLASNDVETTIGKLQDSWAAQRRTTSLDIAGKVSTLKVTGFVENIFMDYIINDDKHEATVCVTAPYYQVSEASSAAYSAPAPVSAVRRLLGFDISDKYRSPAGGITVLGVAANSPAAKAGLADGDQLLKVDAYDVKNFDCGRISAYIEGRAEQHVLLSLQFSHKGVTRTAKIKL